MDTIGFTTGTMAMAHLLEKIPDNKCNPYGVMLLGSLLLLIWMPYGQGYAVGVACQ